MYGTFGHLNLDASTRYNFWFTWLVRLKTNVVYAFLTRRKCGHSFTMDSIPTVSDIKLRRQGEALAEKRT